MPQYHHIKESGRETMFVMVTRKTVTSQITGVCPVLLIHIQAHVTCEPSGGCTEACNNNIFLTYFAD